MPIWLGAAGPSTAGDLIFPVDCALGDDCVVQNHVDRDPGPGATDFTCGTLTYDGHDGTDVRLADEAVMRAGVDVLAAVPGTVVGVRDGMPDTAQGTPGAPDISQRECGNGVLIRHGDGWQVQYCHLRQGTVRVAKGDTVAAGDVLGQIGLSGDTEFPHLHLTVRDQAGRVIDPFDARQQDEACRLPDHRTLWAGIGPGAYRAGGILTAGFLDRLPARAEINAGTAAADGLGAGAPALVFWAHFWGLRDRDRLELALADPEGEVIARTTHVMPRDRAVEFRAVGRRSRDGWSPGTYRGVARLRRGGREIARQEAALVVE